MGYKPCEYCNENFWVDPNRHGIPRRICDPCKKERKRLKSARAYQRNKARKAPTKQLCKECGVELTSPARGRKWYCESCGLARRQHTFRTSRMTQQVTRSTRYGSEHVKATLWDKMIELQDGICLRCQEPFTSLKRSKETQLDHIDRDKGHDPSNFQILCRRCNGRGGKGEAVIDYRPQKMRDYLVQLGCEELCAEGIQDPAMDACIEDSLREWGVLDLYWTFKKGWRRRMRRLQEGSCVVPGCFSGRLKAVHIHSLADGGAHAAWNVMLACPDHADGLEGAGKDLRPKKVQEYADFMA